VLVIELLRYVYITGVELPTPVDSC